MIDNISKLDSLINESNNLLTKEFVYLDEITDYKKKCAIIYISLINENINFTITDIAKRGLKFKVRRIKNPFYRWIYNQLTTARDDISYNAPYLVKHTNSDYFKKYIFRTKQTLEGINHNLKLYQNAKE